MNDKRARNRLAAGGVPFRPWGRPAGRPLSPERLWAWIGGRRRVPFPALTLAKDPSAAAGAVPVPDRLGTGGRRDGLGVPRRCTKGARHCHKSITEGSIASGTGSPV